MSDSAQKILYTIGHSNHSIDEFIALLKQHGITAVADVRSAPYSRYCPWFNKDQLAAALRLARIEYLFFGAELGARPQGSACLVNGQISFQKISETPDFRDGLSRLVEATEKHRVALMCAEKDPLDCHRTILLCRNLHQYKLSIRHILSDGSIENHNQTERRLVKQAGIERTLFEPDLTDAELIERAYDKQSEKIAHQSGALVGSADE
ncbi:MAG: DUF488 domain-containing protein [Phycisphaerae bacterium]|nr:DUF488 domain-containing protein [Phycisphaerae bacterium]